MDFQTFTDAHGISLYEKVLRTSLNWKNSQQLMYVVGATRPEYFKKIRAIVPDHFLLVPGIGAQGGNLEEVCRYGLNADIGLLINASRSVIYASNGVDFAKKAQLAAQEIQQEMERILADYLSGKV